MKMVGAAFKLNTAETLQEGEPIGDIALLFDTGLEVEVTEDGLEADGIVATWDDIASLFRSRSGVRA